MINHANKSILYDGNLIPVDLEANPTPNPYLAVGRDTGEARRDISGSILMNANGNPNRFPRSKSNRVSKRPAHDSDAQGSLRDMPTPGLWHPRRPKVRRSPAVPQAPLKPSIVGRPPRAMPGNPGP